MKSASEKWSSFLIVFLGFLFVFILIQFLYGVFTQAYFWDELGVYSRSSMHMYHHGISLMPSSVPDDLSRGHPLLCSFYFASAFKLFGLKPLVAHAAAALLYSAGFTFFYGILLQKLRAFAAATFTLAVFVQPLFLSQSILILPEMPLMVCSLAAFYFYTTNKNIAAMCMLILALQIKESALVLPFTFLVAEWIKERKLYTKSILLLCLIPLLSFILFIGIQKIERGYFFYPLHTSLTSFEMYFISERWNNFSGFFQHEQGHLYVISALMCCIVLSLLKSFRSLTSFIQSKYIFIPIYIVFAILFLVLNYYLSRYILYFAVFLYLGFGILLYSLLEKFKAYFYLLCLLLAALGIFHWNRKNEYTDVDFSYTRHIQNLQSCIDELNSSEYNGKSIGMDFPANAAYWSENNGYRILKNHKSVGLGDTAERKDFILLTYPGNIADSSKYSADFVSHKEIKTDYAIGRIYKRKQN